MKRTGQRAPFVRIVTVAAAAAVLCAGLAGCAASSSPSAQGLEVSYHLDGATKTVDVSVPGLRCTSGSLLDHYQDLGAADSGDFSKAVVVGVVGTDKSDPSYTITVKLSSDQTFLSTEPFEASADGLKFDSVTGRIVTVDKSGAATGRVADDATLTGSLTCDEKVDGP